MNINYIHVCTDAGKEAAVSARQRASYRNVFAAVHVGRVIDDKRPSVTGAALGVEGIISAAERDPANAATIRPDEKHLFVAIKGRVWAERGFRRASRSDRHRRRSHKQRRSTARYAGRQANGRAGYGAAITKDMQPSPVQLGPMRQIGRGRDRAIIKQRWVADYIVNNGGLLHIAPKKTLLNAVHVGIDYPDISISVGQGVLIPDMVGVDYMDIVHKHVLNDVAGDFGEQRRVDNGVGRNSVLVRPVVIAAGDAERRFEAEDGGSRGAGQKKGRAVGADLAGSRQRCVRGVRRPGALKVDIVEDELRGCGQEDLARRETQRAAGGHRRDRRGHRRIGRRHSVEWPVINHRASIGKTVLRAGGHYKPI